DSFAAAARNVAVAVSPPGASELRPGAPDSPYLPVSALRAVRAVPGVAAADGRVVGPAALIGSNKKIITNNGQPGGGISVAADPALRGFALVTGRVPRGPDEVAVDAATAAAERFRVGQRVGIVSAAGRTLSFRLVGTISLGADHAVENDTVVALPAA